jgi:hypothetical protein
VLPDNPLRWKKEDGFYTFIYNQCGILTLNIMKLILFPYIIQGIDEERLESRYSVFYRYDQEKCNQQIPITFNPFPSCWNEVFLEYVRTKG